MSAAELSAFQDISEKEYKRRIRAWTMYDWANSAFATTILAAVLPVYFSQVAGATLRSPTLATAYWSTGLSISLLIIAVLSPVLGTISDIMRGKKRFLALFAGIGIVSVALLVFVQTGDWVLAAVLAVLGRIGFSGANVFYDALLPHVAKEQDRDKVSTRGYAMGYLGGGILLALNVVMIDQLPETWGPRLSFLSVAVWWAVFSIPILRTVPEPPAAEMSRREGQNVVSASFQRLRETLNDIRKYGELFKFLVAFLIYNDGIGTIIGVAVIYGAELRFGAVDLILALLLVQFVGIPFSLVFGRLATKGDSRRPVYLAFVIFNLVVLPMAGVMGVRLLPANTSGASPIPYASTGSAAGEGVYSADAQAINYSGSWETITVSASDTGRDSELLMSATDQPGAAYEIPFNGEQVEIVYSIGPRHGTWEVFMDGEALIDEETAAQVSVDAFNPTLRYEERLTFQAEEPGEHVLRLVNSDQRNAQSSGNLMTLAEVEVLPPVRRSNLIQILSLILIIEVVGLVFAFLFGRALFSPLAERMDTKRSILLALVVYSVIAIWGFFLDSVVEFWFLAWMVAMVQGGSQALSRSMYASMSPASKSGEFFGLFGVMEKFSAVIGPLIFASAGVLFGSSRPAVLSIIVFFIAGGYLLSKVNVGEGVRVAREEDKLEFQRGV